MVFFRLDNISHILEYGTQKIGVIMEMCFFGWRRVYADLSLLQLKGVGA